MNATAFFLAISLSTPQEPRAGFEVIPLQHLLRPQAAATRLPSSTMLELLDEQHQLVDGPAIEMATLLEPIRKLNAQAIDDGQLRWNGAGGNLLIAGNAAGVTASRNQVQATLRVLTRPVQIELAVWDATDRSSPACVLDGAAFAEFAKDRQPWLRLVDTVAVDRIATLSRLREQSYVRSVGGEVAQKSSINDPLMASYREGAIAVAKALPLAGSDELVLHAQFALAQRRGIPRALQTGMANAPDVELPMLETCLGTFSGRIPNGGALAVVLRGHAGLGGQFVVTLRATAAAAQLPAAEKGFSLLPVGALVDASLLPVKPTADRPEQEMQSSGFVPIEQLVEMAQAAITDGSAEVHGVGSHLLVTGDAPAMASVATLVRALQDRLLRTTTVVANGAVPTTGEGGQERGPSLYEIAAPTLVGRSLQLARLLETSGVKDVEVVIAQEASMAVPLVESMQSGTWIQATTTPADSTIHLDLGVRCALAATPMARSIMPNGVLTPFDVACSRLEHHGLVVNGLPIDHGDGPMLPIEGRSWRSVLQTAVRW